MTHEHRRHGDTGLARLMKVWPLILTLSAIVSGYILSRQKIDDTAALAKSTAAELVIVERDLAVLKEIVRDIRRGRRPR